MAKLAFLSDLHWETEAEAPAPRNRLEGCDALLVLGDVLGRHSTLLSGEDASSVTRLSRWWDGPIFLVPGNHEFEGVTLSRELDRLRRHARGTNVQVLYNDSVVVGSGREQVRILGTTLWTDFCLHGKDRQAYDYERCAKKIKDLQVRADGSRLKFRDVMDEHSRARIWLEQQLKCGGIPTVVATHFAPHPGSIAPKRDDSSPLISWFVNRLPDELVGQATAWLHGHTHDRFDYEVNGCRVMCNPSGFSQVFVLDELNEVAREMLLRDYKHLARDGQIRLDEVEGFRGPQVIKVDADGVEDAL